MLFADKNALRTQLKVNMLRIRERELTYYTNNCLAISTSSALLAGFAWYGLTEVPFDSNSDAAIQTMYLVVTTLIMGLELLTVVNATLCAILGPGLELRGPDGSMHNAVQGMTTHYRFTLTCFSLGLICFISPLLYSWMQFDWTLALRACSRLLPFILQRHWWRVYKRFRLPSDSAVTGAFNAGGQLAATGVPEAPTAGRPRRMCNTARDGPAAAVRARVGAQRVGDREHERGRLGRAARDGRRRRGAVVRGASGAERRDVSLK